MALGVTGEVVMPSFTFVGTAHAMRWIGLTPVFCEIDPETHTLNPAAVQRAVTDRTGAILGVHLWGRSGHAGELAEIARHHRLPLIFDAAHAFGATTGLGDVEVLSFHATKVASTGEGGALITDDPRLADRLRAMRNFGFVGYDEVAMLGTNAKMSELSAAIGIASVESYESLVDVNRTNHRRYTDELSDIASVKVLDYREPANFHYVVIEVPPELRDDLLAVLHAENVVARRYFHPGCHRHEPYRRSPASLPLTEELCARVLTLPTGPAIGEDDIAQVCAVIRCVIEGADDVQARLTASQQTRG